ncbi:MAG TPA: hypothetical protein VFZ65_16700 [Planctomycetota bacterium]|nr:hypothetical protein [Planctomycetota bacterium]
MQPSNEEARRLLQQVVLGDLPATAPEFLAACAAHPELEQQLAGLQAVRAQLDELAADAGDAADVAPQAAPLATPADRELVRRNLGPRSTRGWTWPLLLAAALLLGTVAMWWSQREVRPPGGVLGGSDAVRVERTGDGIVLSLRQTPSPIAAFRLSLWLDDAATPLVETFSSVPIRLGKTWQDAIDAARTARLRIEVSDPGIVYDVPLKP